MNQRFRQWVCAVLLGCVSSLAEGAPVKLVDEVPLDIRAISPGVFLVDFGKVAFGNVRFMPPADAKGEVQVHFGEAISVKRVDRKPPGTVRYAVTALTLDGGKSLVAAPPADKRNTKQPAAVLTPPEWGVVLPFRWLEIEGWPGELRPEQLRRQAAFSSTWDDEAAAFESSDETLNRIWELCRYSIKATTFAGVYVDGDRERIPYEADAYLNQLSHYATDHDVQMARDTFDRLMEQPTWPTEWASHLIFMVHADFMHTGDKAWLAARYEALKPKLLLDRAREDGLLTSNAKQVRRDDIVDWPQAERDGFVFTPVNAVVNAFHLRTLAMMADLAAALGKSAEAAEYREREARTRKTFQEVFYDAGKGAYRDGEGVEHCSQHASLFPLAFGLVPQEHRAAVTSFVVKREMACSVYAAQYLLEGLFTNEATTEALALISAPGDRSWKHMLESGTTITWEAWDQKYKPNQDWNHAWGAAPANLFPRFLLGAQPLTAGWEKAVIRPHPGTLKFAEGKIPTPRGPIQIRWENEKNFRLNLKLPTRMNAQVELPAPKESKGVTLDGKPTAAKRSGSRWLLDEPISGTATLEVR